MKQPKHLEFFLNLEINVCINLVEINTYSLSFLILTLLIPISFFTDVSHIHCWKGDDNTIKSEYIYLYKE
jgi:hypothetical protein